jgi:hemerythrin superfamily protein
MFGIGESEHDAISVLKSDHKAVDELFKEYEERKKDGKAAAKVKIAIQICDALTVHAAIEEEIFYPAARHHADDVRDLVDEAAVEHQTLKDIIARLQAAPSSDPLYDAGVKVLSEYVKHHVEEEESELFPKVRKSDLDLVALGERLLARKTELQKGGAKQRRAA